MNQVLKDYADKAINKIINRVTSKIKDDTSLVDNIAYRVTLETLLNDSNVTNPHKLFSGISDEFWLWLYTDGYHKHSSLRKILPGMPNEEIQIGYTGVGGNETLKDGFKSYSTFKALYEKHIGPISNCESILDYGCGWGRIIRFFIKDIEPSKIWGCDPVEEMIAICKETNKWCNFENIGTVPPTNFEDNSFEFIFSFSVFSHLSEEMHNRILLEMHRILKPGGLLLITTRKRNFLEWCAQLRKKEDLSTMNNGPRSSAAAFLDTEKALEDYDAGKFCFSQLGKGEWSYWGETAIPESYVKANWTKLFNFLEFVDDPKRCEQNVIAVQKPFK